MAFACPGGPNTGNRLVPGVQVSRLLPGHRGAMAETPHNVQQAAASAVVRASMSNYYVHLTLTCWRREGPHCACTQAAAGAALRDGATPAAAAAIAAAAALVELGGPQPVADQLNKALQNALTEIDMWEIVHLDVASPTRFAAVSFCCTRHPG